MFTNVRFYDGNDLKINGILNDYAKFVSDNQLKSVDRWAKLVEPFITKEDSDGFWRGEFFGKEMRGASLMYEYTRDEELYRVLVFAVEKILAVAEENGRISAYTVETEFNGWDMWCRKYVLTGLQHFYRICKSDELKSRIINVMKGHADYIISKIGDGEGQKSITKTSSWWGCVNSCTILEPIIELYKETGEERYLTFAKYIISTGGSSDCNFLELALENKLYPYQYPVVKAYETTSYFEGLLAYYEITGEEKYFTAVKNFIEGVAKTDMTIIGCAGCTHELFDNSSVKQTEYSEQIMQETCVTVTWMRISARLFALTGDPKYIDRIEKSGYNALYGSINTKNNGILNMFMKKYVYGMVFDSYSPLYKNSRGRGTGGYMEFASGGSCGCCDAIGACGVALMPLTAAMQCDEGIIVNYLFGGELKVTDKNGKEATLKFISDYPGGDELKIKIRCDGKVDLNFFIRRPEYCKKVLINGEDAGGSGYFALSKEFENGDEINISYENEIKIHKLNGKTAFTYGVMTLAADENKQDIDFDEPIKIAEPVVVRKSQAQAGELLRFEAATSDDEKLILTDYQSCGKNWLDKKNRISVWLD